jgi:hypothetical protein
VTAGLDAAEALARLLCPGEDTALELGGATAILESIAGSRLTADVLATARHELTDGERDLLRPGRDNIAIRRRALLRTASGIAAVEATVILLPHRVPPAARADLGISRTGALRGGHRNIPLGTALRGLGVRRLQLQAACTPGHADAAGAAQALYSQAALHLAAPLALVTERFYLGFLEAFPPPWAALHVPAHP